MSFDKSCSGAASDLLTIFCLKMFQMSTRDNDHSPAKTKLHGYFWVEAGSGSQLKLSSSSKLGLCVYHYFHFYKESQILGPFNPHHSDAATSSSSRRQALHHAYLLLPCSQPVGEAVAPGECCCNVKGKNQQSIAAKIPNS
jgi:hypothetical protein